MHKLDEQNKHCSNCALYVETGCIALAKRCNPCWAKCSNKKDLKKRFSGMIKYSKDMDTIARVKKQYENCLRRLEKIKYGRKN
ncbi:hypothetical protein HZI73_22460 [Vallitalea pronyensis]|uniref:Uncharacterized protein n=1 Tax=Vallitalea pronyensis TaxID=1348613 RepID=A0A8J8MPB2_9FIRM|nr:hypothetical protein [Vallitalea pronyensis]QUI24893.1 hypothetical protein HZI73_22460 [Vallitalea pronyensis]